MALNKLQIPPVPFINPETNDIDLSWRRVLEIVAASEWTQLDFTGSNLTDILTRLHDDLQGIGEADDTDTDATKNKHVSNAMVKVYKDHVDITNANPHGTDHDQLDAIGQADETSTDTTKDKHVSNNQLKVAYDDIDNLEAKFTVTTESATFGAGATMNVLVDAAAGNVIVNMPTTASAITAKARYNIKKIDSSVNTVTVTPNGTETIDGAATMIIATQYDSMQIVPFGTEWSII